MNQYNMIDYEKFSAFTQLIVEMKIYQSFNRPFVLVWKSIVILICPTVFKNKLSFQFLISLNEKSHTFETYFIVDQVRTSNFCPQ